MGHSLQVEHTFHSERDAAPVHHNIVHSHHKGRERRKQSQQDADTNTCTRDSQQLLIVMTNSVTVVVVVGVVVHSDRMGCARSMPIFFSSDAKHGWHCAAAAL